MEMRIIKIQGKRYKRKYRNLLLWVIIVLMVVFLSVTLSSCVDGLMTNPDLPTITIQEPPEEATTTSIPEDTQQLTPITVEEPVQTSYPSNNGQVNLDSLDSGQYLVVSKTLPTYGADYIHDVKLVIVNINGKEIGFLDFAQGEVTISPDQTMIAYWEGVAGPSSSQNIVLLDLNNQTERIILGEFHGGSGITWSPDSAILAFSSEQSIYTLDVYNQELVKVLDCPNVIDLAAYCVVLGWSPGDNWLAYRVDIERSGSLDSRQLTYLLNTNCFSDATTCPSMDYGVLPFRTYGTWSPDGNRFAAAANDGDVYIFDVTSWEIERILHTDRLIQSIHWSPDGQWLGFSSPRGIGLISPENGDWKFIMETPLSEDTTLAFWIEIGE